MEVEAAAAATAVEVVMEVAVMEAAVVVTE